jgi:hypothetical protein
MISGLCAVHCLVLFVLTSMHPVLWLSQRLLGMPAGFWLAAEWVTAGVALVIACIAFAGRGHTRLPYLPRALAALGGCVVVVGMFARGHGLSIRSSLIVAAGGALLVSAHLLNLRARR